jgi:hypothetical protein
MAKGNSKPQIYQGKTYPSIAALAKELNISALYLGQGIKKYPDDIEKAIEHCKTKMNGTGNTRNKKVEYKGVEYKSYSDLARNLLHMGSVDRFNAKRYELMKKGRSEEEAITEILFGFYGLDHNDENNDILTRYILNNLKKLCPLEYLNNPYVKNINANSKLGKYQLRNISYEPYQLFAYDDIYLDEYKEYSRIGYFTSDFPYLALTEGNNVWMSLNPNEIETMKPYIAKAKGDVLVLGLGMGYVPYMVSSKEDVKSVTIIEKDK